MGRSIMRAVTARSRGSSCLLVRLPRVAAPRSLYFRDPHGYPDPARPMDLGLAGRVALVCGSTRGIGHAVAKALAQEGARVAVNGRHEDSVNRVALQLTSETGQTVLPFVADVGVPAQAQGLVERVHRDLGRPVV